MENIKIVDMENQEAVSASEMEQVKGGPIYMKLDGVDGSVTAAGHEKWIELSSVSSPIYRS